MWNSATGGAKVLDVDILEGGPLLFSLLTCVLLMVALKILDAILNAPPF